MRRSYIKRIINNIYSYYEPFDSLGIINIYRKFKDRKEVTPENKKLDSATPVKILWPPDVRKPRVGLVKSEKGCNAYWPKFERFLKTNDINYSYFDIKSSDFILEIKKYDVIIWRTPPEYADQWEAADKIEFMEEYLNKIVMPPRQSLWMYEDKVRMQWLLQINNLPVIKTFISFSKEETKNYIETCHYPFLSKDKTSSSSNGVFLVKNKRQARKLWRKIFFRGLKLENSYVKQKDYVFFQEYVPNKGFDLRVIMIGDSYFGYYRYPSKKDFRASGSGIVIKESIPKKVLNLAKKTRECLPKSYLLAVDFLQDTRDDKFYIIEISIFTQVLSSENLVVDGIPGRYIEQNGDFVFEPGRFWIQELMMKELMKDWIAKNTVK